jgi:nucleoside-diphosphate-sugar epimerase
MKRICILGVNGFIGYHLSKRIIDTSSGEVYGTGMHNERVADLMGHPPFHLFERHRDRQGMDRVSHTQVRHGAAAGGDTLPATYVKELLCAFELGFEANHPLMQSRIKYDKRIVYPSTSRGVRDVLRGRVRSGDFRADAGIDQRATLDLRLLQAADGPGELGLRL